MLTGTREDMDQRRYSACTPTVTFAAGRGEEQPSAPLPVPNRVRGLPPARKLGEGSELVHLAGVGPPRRAGGPPSHRTTYCAGGDGTKRRPRQRQSRPPMRTLPSDFDDLITPSGTSARPLPTNARTFPRTWPYTRLGRHEESSRARYRDGGRFLEREVRRLRSQLLDCGGRELLERAVTDAVDGVACMERADDPFRTRIAP
jgi:hypothetical protein